MNGHENQKLPRPGETLKTSDWWIRNDGGGYGVRLREFRTAATQVVIVEWTHPGDGYWSDAAILCRGAHSDPRWTEIWFVSWDERGMEDVKELASSLFPWSGSVFDKENLVTLED